MLKTISRWNMLEMGNPLVGQLDVVAYFHVVIAGWLLLVVVGIFHLSKTWHDVKRNWQIIPFRTSN